MPIENPFTDAELIMLINLLGPVVMERYRQDPDTLSPEAKLRGKLIKLEKEVGLQEQIARTRADGETWLRGLVFDKRP